MRSTRDPDANRYFVSEHYFSLSGLSFFRIPRTWRDIILNLGPKVRSRNCIANAERLGKLVWNKKSLTWSRVK